jgi:hypothetical protein
VTRAGIGADQVRVQAVAGQLCEHYDARCERQTFDLLIDIVELVDLVVMRQLQRHSASAKMQ